MNLFENLGLSQKTLRAIEEKGFTEPTPIQAAVIPLLLQNVKDVVGQAQTGTGKTAAFGLPMIETLDKGKHTSALILTPTRELAIQVADEINSLQGNKGLRIEPIYGGQSIETQLKKLKKGVDIVVGTPGRVRDHLQRKRLKLDRLSYLILDEADEMLNMGFVEEIEEILEYVNPDRRTLLFSATMPKPILNIAQNYMDEYELVKVTPQQVSTELVEQVYYQVNEGDKLEALCRVMDMDKDFYGLVFCRTKVDADKVSRKLIDKGYNADALHGDITQQQREKVLNSFKRRTVNVLVATDVAARGIDVQDLTHVVNYTIPHDPEAYVHRIGRTGRAGKMGTAVTFVTPADLKHMKRIERFANAKIQHGKPPKVRDIIRARKARIKNDVLAYSGSEIDEIYLKMAHDLLAENDPEQMLAAMLKYAFRDKLDRDNYREISAPAPFVEEDSNGKVRLFVARGKKVGMNDKKLKQLVCKGVDVAPQKIRNIRVFDDFSFITVPLKDADRILKIHGRGDRKRKPLVERAKVPAGAKR